MSDRNGPTGAGPLVPGIALPARARAKRKGRKPPARARRASGSRPPARAAGQARATRSSPSPTPEGRDGLAATMAAAMPVDAEPRIVAILPDAVAEIAQAPDGPADPVRGAVASAIDPTAESPTSGTASVADAPDSSEARAVAGVSDGRAASTVHRRRVVARRRLAAILTTVLIVPGVWAMRPGLDRMGHPTIAAIPGPANSPTDRQDAVLTSVSVQGLVDPGVAGGGWITPPARVSPAEIPLLEVPPPEISPVEAPRAAAPLPPRASPPDRPIVPAPSPAAPTVAASGIAPPAAPAFVPLPPRRPVTLAVRRPPSVPPEVSSAAPVAADPVPADANVWSPPREAGRYRLPWGVAQLGERSSDDTARGPQWTFAAEP